MKLARTILTGTLVAALVGIMALERRGDRSAESASIFEIVAVGTGPLCGVFEGLPSYGAGFLYPGIYNHSDSLRQPYPETMVLEPFGLVGLGVDGKLEGGTVSDAAEIRATWDVFDQNLGVGSIVGAFRILSIPEADAWSAIVDAFEQRGAVLFPHEAMGHSWVALWQRDVKGWRLVAETTRAGESSFLARTLDARRPYQGPPRLDGVKAAAE